MWRVLLQIILWLGIAWAVQYWSGIIMVTLYPSDASVPVDDMWNWNLVRIEAALSTMIGAACAWGLLRLRFPQTFKLRSANASTADASS